MVIDFHTGKTCSNRTFRTRQINREQALEGYISRLREDLLPMEFLDVLTAIISPAFRKTIRDKDLLKRIEEYYSL